MIHPVVKNAERTTRNSYNKIAHPSLDSSIGSPLAWGLVDRRGPGFESCRLLNKKGDRLRESNDNVANSNEN